MGRAWVHGDSDRPRIASRRLRVRGASLQDGTDRVRPARARRLRGVWRFAAGADRPLSLIAVPGSTFASRAGPTQSIAAVSWKVSARGAQVPDPMQPPA